MHKLLDKYETTIQSNFRVQIDMQAPQRKFVDQDFTFAVDNSCTLIVRDHCLNHVIQTPSAPADLSASHGL
jgi:hypothetical protein